VASPLRTPANVARDQYRHPLETLSFFGVKPNHNVVEIWPGGGWYTEILAPYVASGGGTYYAVAPEQSLANTRKLVASNPAAYGHTRFAAFPVREPREAKVPDGSADVVLTFRNVHNWMMGDKPFADRRRPAAEKAAMRPQRRPRRTPVCGLALFTYMKRSLFSDLGNLKHPLRTRTSGQLIGD
jgi:predicted methyltransferase